MGFRKDNNLESVKVDSEKKTQKVDRVVLDLESTVNVQSLQQQVNEQLGDLVQISLKDLVNFLLQERAFSLSEDELNKLKSKHFDLVKALRKATSEVIRAKQNGSEIQLDEVLKIIQTPGVIQSMAPKKTRGRRKKIDSSPGIQDGIEPKNSNPRVSAKASTEHIEDRKSDSKSNRILDFSNAISS